jgi:hypothetical protein
MCAACGEKLSHWESFYLHVSLEFALTYAVSLTAFVYKYFFELNDTVQFSPQPTQARMTKADSSLSI